MLTNEDIADLIIGSGALTYSWYRKFNYKVSPDGTDVWVAEISVEDDEEEDDELQDVFGPEEIIKTCLYIADDKSDDKYGVSRSTREEAKLLAERNDDCDLDADMADQILQVMIYGQVVFG